MSAYTNDMRYAVRAIGNPTKLHVDVSEKDGTIYLLIDQELYSRLERKDKLNFAAYLKEVTSIIEMGGGTVEVKPI